MATINIKTYCGAKGDGVTDDGPAFQKAFYHVNRRVASKILIPTGKYLIKTPVNINGINGGGATASLLIQGYGSSCQIFPDTGESPAFILSNLESLQIQDLYFVGLGVPNNASQTLQIRSCLQAALQNTHFYGIGSLVGDGSSIYAWDTDLTLERCSFRGGYANSALSFSMVAAHNWRGMVVKECHFVDYGALDGFVSRTPFQATYSWIKLGNTNQFEGNALSAHFAEIRNCRFDEGALMAVAVVPTTTPPQLRGVRFSNNTVNLYGTGTGFYAHNTGTILIEDSLFGYTNHPSTAIYVTGVEYLKVSNSQGMKGARALTAQNTGRVVLENSKFAEINVPANILTVI